MMSCEQQRPHQPGGLETCTSAGSSIDQLRGEEQEVGMRGYHQHGACPPQLELMGDGRDGKQQQRVRDESSMMVSELIRSMQMFDKSLNTVGTPNASNWACIDRSRNNWGVDAPSSPPRQPSKTGKVPTRGLWDDMKRNVVSEFGGRNPPSKLAG
mmetsp:Transcript_12240/g.24160  ORF Transcript_12240/g.24160 Transcript_12240/m.24160 type:complete len:155 (+) Transcript_12240:112-576(+)